MSALMPTPARRQNLPEIVADEIERMIIDNRMEPGESLPTEVALMERFAVSRTVVREAARTLVQKGLVDVRAGRGMTVRPMSMERLAQEFSLLLRAGRAEVSQLAQLRELLEPAIAAEAARSRTEDDLRHLAEVIIAGEAALEDPQEFMKADLAFHEGVAKASGNPFFVLVTAPIGALLQDMYADSRDYALYEQQTNSEHGAIFAAISAGDRERASAETLKHLSRVHETLLQMLRHNDGKSRS